MGTQIHSKWLQLAIQKYISAIQWSAPITIKPAILPKVNIHLPKLSPHFNACGTVAQATKSPQTVAKIKTFNGPNAALAPMTTNAFGAKL